MALVTAGELYRCVFYTRADDQIGINVRHFRVANITIGAPTEENIAGDMESFFATQYKPLIANTADWKGLEITKISPLPARVPVFANVNVGPGTGGPNLLPRQTCGLFKVGSPLGGRQNRGRVYVPFPATAHETVDGHPTLAYQGLLDNLALNLIGLHEYGIALNKANCQWVVRHAPGLTTTDLTTRVVRARWATQKRRGDYGTPNPLAP